MYIYTDIYIDNIDGTHSHERDSWCGQLAAGPNMIERASWRASSRATHRNTMHCSAHCVFCCIQSARRVHSSSLARVALCSMAIGLEWAPVDEMWRARRLEGPAEFIRAACALAHGHRAPVPRERSRMGGPEPTHLTSGVSCGGAQIGNAR